MTYLVVFISILLFIATVFVTYQIKQDATAERINNKKRLLAWWMIFAFCTSVFLCAYLLGPIVIQLFITTLLLWVVYELCGLLKINIKTLKPILFLLVISVFSMIMFCFPDQCGKVFIAAIMTVFIAYLTPVNSSLYFISFSLYCCFSLSSIALIASLSLQQQSDYNYLLLTLFFIIAVNDIAQYVIGKQFGKTPIAPKISPNKTVAGVWGGIFVTSLLSVLLLPHVLNTSILEAFAIGSVLSLAGFWGDLVVSKLKRGLQIKDSGASIMGHGGILDRVDSLLLAAPVFGLLLLSGGHL